MRISRARTREKYRKPYSWQYCRSRLKLRYPLRLKCGLRAIRRRWSPRFVLPLVRKIRSFPSPRCGLFASKLTVHSRSRSWRRDSLVSLAAWHYCWHASDCMAWLRRALGAQRGNILWMVLRDTLALLLFGLAVGIPAALGASHFISSQLYRLRS